jgi:tellurite resistance protein TehA-like permease|tara:strand:+ start:165 stop:368 length:204 start_codon:yes stop_codon:yes gene_type:complete
MKFKLVITVLALLPVLVLAQNAPNMMGTWAGTFNTTVMVTSGHHIGPNKTNKKFYFNKLPFTLVIER